ncbi:hypothetical protein AgCh_012830 [Apium graveolens]
MEACRSPRLQKLRSPSKGKVVELVAYTDSESTDEDIMKEVPKENQHNNKRRDKDSSMEENVTMPPVKWKKARAKRPQLSPFREKKWVEKSGFGALLDFDLEMIPSKLSLKVVQAFNHKSVMIEIEKGNIEITEKDIFYVLGLPHGGKKVEPKDDKELNDDGKSAQQKVTNDIDNNDGSWPNDENITEMSKKDYVDLLRDRATNIINSKIQFEKDLLSAMEKYPDNMELRVVKDVFNEIFDKTNAEVALLEKVE